MAADFSAAVILLFNYLIIRTPLTDFKILHKLNDIVLILFCVAIFQYYI